MTKIFNYRGRLILGLIILAELFSIFTFYVPAFNNAAVVIIATLFLVLTFYRLDYGVLLLLTELFIGSKGYLFYFESGGLQISLRIIFWLIVLSVWFGQFLAQWLKEKKFPWSEKFPYLKASLALLFFILFGFVQGWLRGHDFNNLFFDFNGWLYFFLLLPLYQAFIVSDKRREAWEILRQIFILTLVWLSVKTLILFYFFTHNAPSILPDIYRWLRLSGLAEVTPAPGGFWRVFFQSHVFLLLAAPFLILPLDGAKKEGRVWIFRLLLVLCFAGVIISMSRSFWLALAVLLLFLAIFIWQGRGIKAAFRATWQWVLALVISLLLILAIAKFPWPTPSGSFNLSVFADRANIAQDESAISSRWALLDSLKEELKQNPILGQGFGALVTYKSSDPRIAETTADKMQTTYAFEWGWLDVWLKIGLGGLLAYLYLLFIITKSSWRSNPAIGLSLLALMVANIFTPYANHPLGITWIMLMMLLAWDYKLDKK